MSFFFFGLLIVVLGGRADGLLLDWAGGFAVPSASSVSDVLVGAVSPGSGFLELSSSLSFFAAVGAGAGEGSCSSSSLPDSNSCFRLSLRLSQLSVESGRFELCLSEGSSRTLQYDQNREAPSSSFQEVVLPETRAQSAGHPLKIGVGSAKMSSKCFKKTFIREVEGTESASWA